MPNWHHLEYAEFDLLTVLTAPDTFDTPIVIVGIDEPSFAELKYQWPWSRKIHGQLVEKLHQQGAAVTAFDVVFAEPSTIEDDQYFAKAIKNTGNVVLAGDIVMQKHKQFDQLMHIEPLDLLLQAGASTGISAITVDSDLVVRKMPEAEDSFWRETLSLYQKKMDTQLPGNTILSSDARVRYLGPDHSFTYVSYYQALHADTMLPAGIFKDKIVLVGMDIKASPEPGAGRFDSFATPFFPVTGWLTPGVEIEATFMANAILNNSILEAPRTATLMLTAAVLVLVSFFMRPWRPLRSAIAVVIVVGITALFSGWLFLVNNIWLPSIAALLAPALLFLTQGGTSFFYERRQRRQVMNAFEHYVSPEIVREMVANPESLVLGGIRRKLTIMFTDLAGFTSHTEKMEPEDVARLLNRHMTVMTQIIMEYGGTIDKYIGDAIMAFWGAPLNDDEQSLHACEAAIKMQESTDRLRDEFIADGLPGIHMRIGINTGTAVVGNMGSQDRFDYTVLGDAVNLASRLEGINKLYGTRILVSDTTANEVNGKIPLLNIDKVMVKGKTQPVEIYIPGLDHMVSETITSAICAYRNQDWDNALGQWGKLLTNEFAGTIARVYINRISELRQQNLSADWDGAVSLEKM